MSLWRLAYDRNPTPEVVVRTLFAVLAVALVLAACSDVPTDPASLGAGPGLADVTTYCPAPFTQVSSKASEETDHNGDFQICKLDILLDDKVTIHTSYVDNNVPVQLGACPEGFTPLLVKIGTSTDDRNEDGWVCEATRPSGTVVTIDNRFDVAKVVDPKPEPEK